MDTAVPVTLNNLDSDEILVLSIDYDGCLSSNFYRQADGCLSSYRQANVNELTKALQDTWVDEDQTVDKDRYTILTQNYNNESLDRLIECNNEHFLNPIIEEIKKCGSKKVVLIIGSNRQSFGVDITNALWSGSCYPAFLKLTETIQSRVDSGVEVSFDPYLMADLYNDLPAGTAFDDAMKVHKSGAVPPDSEHCINGFFYGEPREWSKNAEHLYQYKRNDLLGEYAKFPWFFDSHKITLVYAQMHRLATNNPDKKIRFRFVDDREDILGKVIQFFQNHPDLLPPGFTLECGFYNGAGPVELRIAIQASPDAIMDIAFEQSVKAMIASVGYDLSAMDKSKYDAAPKEALTADNLLAHADEVKVWRSQNIAAIKVGQDPVPFVAKPVVIDMSNSGLVIDEPPVPTPGPSDIKTALNQQPSQKLVKRYNVRSKDADGCIFNQYYQFENPSIPSAGINKSPNRLIEANEELIQADADEITSANYEATFFVVGSNRQDACIDLNNFKHHQSEIFVGSCYPAIKGIAEAVAQRTDRPVYLNTMLLADIYSDHPLGFAFEQAIKLPYSQPENVADLKVVSSVGHSYGYFQDDNKRMTVPYLNPSVFDETKISLLYAQIHEHARMINALDPNAEIDFDFDDDTNEVLSNLQHFFTRFPDFIPNNVTLRLRKYAGPIEGGESITRIKPIIGTGSIDFAYAENTKIIQAQLKAIAPPPPPPPDKRTSKSLYDFTKFPIDNVKRLKETSSVANNSGFSHIICCKPDVLKDTRSLAIDGPPAQVSSIDLTRTLNLDGGLSKQSQKLVIASDQEVEASNKKLVAAVRKELEEERAATFKQAAAAAKADAKSGARVPYCSEPPTLLPDIRGLNKDGIKIVELNEQLAQRGDISPDQQIKDAREKVFQAIAQKSYEDAAKKLLGVLQQDIEALSKVAQVEDIRLTAPVQILFATRQMLEDLNTINSRHHKKQELIDVIQAYEGTCRDIVGHNVYIAAIGTFIVALVIAVLVYGATSLALNAIGGNALADIFQHIATGAKDIFENGSITVEATRFIISGSLGLFVGVVGGIATHHCFFKPTPTLEAACEFAKGVKADVPADEAGASVAFQPS